MERQFTLTGDGSHTLYVPGMGDHYHSVHGAVQESLHIFIGQGYDRHPIGPLSILEVGFGTGLNAFLTALRAISDHKTVHYETWEAFPLKPDESNRLNYPEIIGGSRELFTQLHQSAWECDSQINEFLILNKKERDFRDFTSSRWFDLVYFDAFGPDFQPDLWTAEIFRKIFDRLNPSASLVTYSAKGQVRRNLKEAGFRIEKAPGPPGKREITIANKV